MGGGAENLVGRQGRHDDLELATGLLMHDHSAKGIRFG
jgi:hypothetical protein